MNCFYSRLFHFFSKLFLLVTLTFVTANFAFAGDDGAKLFKQNCSRCHSIGKGIVTGPDLKDVHTRVPNEEWLFGWIKNNKKMLASGDAYGTQRFNEFKQQGMDVFDGVISDEEIKTIIAYIKNPPIPEKGKEETIVNGKHSEEQGFPIFTVLLITVIALLFLVIILGTVKRHLQDSVNAKKGLPPSEPVSAYQWVRTHKRISALVVIILGGFCVRWIYIGVMEIGVYETYKPEQPIKFSHKVHAGKLSINCVYCHSGAEKGRTSGVPSANVCMNCHKAIKEGPLTGTAEIAKIYDAVGWDVEKAMYSKPQKPIKWNRVHALPDFAYFNHSQHVVVGKQDCKNCHGDVATMDEAEQASPLTMGWCVDCHRKTEVPGMASNPYYADLHAKLKEKYKGEPITVEKMGGLDCIKCHY